MARKVIVVATLGLSCAVAAMAPAQSKDKSKGSGETGLQMGAVVGANFFTFGGSDASNVTTRTAFYAGTALTIPLGRTFFLQPELLYSAEGAKTSVVDSTFGTIEGTFKLAYISVPVLFGLNLGGGGSGLRLYAGPVLNLNVTCDLEATNQGSTMSSSCKDAGLSAKSSTVGATVGAGVRLRVGHGAILLDARYSRDLSDAFDGSNVRNQGLSVGAGFTVPLGAR